jgi:hypothetical protein
MRKSPDDMSNLPPSHSHNFVKLLHTACLQTFFHHLVTFRSSVTMTNQNNCCPNAVPIAAGDDGLVNGASPNSHRVDDVDAMMLNMARDLQRQGGISFNRLGFNVAPGEEEAAQLGDRPPFNLNPSWRRQNNLGLRRMNAVAPGSQADAMQNLLRSLDRAIEIVSEPMDWTVGRRESKDEQVIEQ